MSQETFDIGKAFAETSSATPLIMLMKEEVNPCKYIFRFADEMGFQGRKLRILSMGSGQEEKARETIKVRFLKFKGMTSTLLLKNGNVTVL